MYRELARCEDDEGIHHPDAAGGGVCEIARIRNCNVSMLGSCGNVGIALAYDFVWRIVQTSEL